MSNVQPPEELRNITGYHWLKRIHDDSEMSFEFTTGQIISHICPLWSATYQCWQDPLGNLPGIHCIDTQWIYLGPATPPQ